MHKQKKVSILVAYTKNKRVIGNKGMIPWQLTSERNQFKRICAGKIILMGRKSFDEIGHALPYCTILIISKSMKKAPKDCLLANSLEKALEIAVEKSTSDEILIAGGQQLYNQVLDFTDIVYATEIDADFTGDTFFPSLPGQWDSTLHANCVENDIHYQYITYKKRP